MINNKVLGLPFLYLMFLVSPVVGQDTTSTTREDMVEALRASHDIIATYRLDEGLAEALADALETWQTLPEEQAAIMAQAAGSEIAELTGLFRLLREDLRMGASPSRRISSLGFPEAVYPDVSTVEFVFDELVDLVLPNFPDPVDFLTLCDSTRVDAEGQFHAAWTHLKARTKRDIFTHICNQDFLGANVSLLCVGSELLYAAAAIVHERLVLCEKINESAENHASYERLEHIHGDIASVESSIAVVDSKIGSSTTEIVDEIGDSADDIVGAILAVIASHDGDIKSKIDTHDSEIKSRVSTHDADIKTAVATHDTDIKAALAQHDADIKAEHVIINQKLDLIQETLDKVIEWKRVHLQATELKEKKRYLVASSEAGLAVDVTLLGVSASVGTTVGPPNTFVDVPAVASLTGSTGFLDVVIDLPNNMQNAKIFEFRVKHVHYNDDGSFSHEHFGRTVFHRVAENNSDGGQ